MIRRLYTGDVRAGGDSGDFEAVTTVLIEKLLQFLEVDFAGQYAVEGFELNVTDYLLKPIEFERFFVAVRKVPGAPETLTSISPAGLKAERDFFFISVQKKKVRVLFQDILYVESQREYVKIVTEKGEYLTKLSTREIESLLPEALFRRVHRSFIVSLRRIESYSAEMVEVSGVSIPIGKGYRDSMDDL